MASKADYCDVSCSVMAFGVMASKADYCDVSCSVMAFGVMASKADYCDVSCSVMAFANTVLITMLTNTLQWQVSDE